MRDNDEEEYEEEENIRDEIIHIRKTKKIMWKKMKRKKGMRRMTEIESVIS